MGFSVKRQEDINEIAFSIKRVFESDSLWSILLNESDVRSGPFDGACLICAKALIRANGNGSLVRIVSDLNDGQTEHYGANIDGDIYDFDGLHGSPSAWIETFAAKENMAGRQLSFAMGWDSESEIPDDPATERKVAALFQKEMMREIEAIKDGTYFGIVLCVEAGFVTQKVNREGATVRHDAANLSAAVNIGDVVNIQYRGGTGKVVRKEKSGGVCR